MHISKQQYQKIHQEYEAIRQRNLNTELDRKSEIHACIPAIAQIDAEIAHRKITSAKYRITHPTSSQELEAISDIGLLLQEKQLLLSEANYPIDYLAPIYSCPHCQDTGYIGTAKCSCFQRKVQELFIKESHLKEVIFRDNFSHFNREYYSREIPEGKEMSPYDNISTILEHTYQFIQNFSPRQSQNLLIYGNAGVGKTFLTHCIGAELLTNHVQVLYLTAYQLFDQLAEYTFHRKEYQGDSPNEIFDAELLIIDDLGTEVSNAFTNAQLFLCINERLLKHRSTIISTNLSLKEISASYTERVFSRIIESYQLMQIYGEDIRIQKALTKSLR